MDYRIDQLRYRLREDPSSRLFFQLGELLRKEGELGEASRVLRAGLDYHPRYVAAWVSLGRAELELKEYRRAERAFARALELDPEHAVAARQLGRVAVAEGEWVRAVKAFKLARVLQPRDESLELEIAEVEEKLATLGLLEGERSAPQQVAVPTPDPDLDDADGAADAFMPDALGADSESEEASVPLTTMAVEDPFGPMPSIPPPPAAPPVFDVVRLSEDDPFSVAPSGDTGVFVFDSDVFESGLAPEAEAETEAEAELELELEAEPEAEAEAESEAVAEPEPAFGTQAAELELDDETEALLADEPDETLVVEENFVDEPTPVMEGVGAAKPDFVEEPFSELELELEPTEPEVIEIVESERIAEQEPEPEPEAEAAESESEPETEPELMDGQAAAVAMAAEAEPQDQPELAEEEIRETQPLAAIATPVPDETMTTVESEAFPLPTLTLARLAVDQGDLALAEETLLGVLERDPDSEQAHELLSAVRRELAGDEGTGAATTLNEAKIVALRGWLDTVRLAAERRAQ